MSILKSGDVIVSDNPDGSATVTFSERATRLLEMKNGQRWVWTITDDNRLLINKRRKNYKLRKNEFDSFIKEV